MIRIPSIRRGQDRSRPPGATLLETTRARKRAKVGKTTTCLQRATFLEKTIQGQRAGPRKTAAKK